MPQESFPEKGGYKVGHEPKFVARYDKSETPNAQCLWDHLENVSYLAGESAKKIGLKSVGQLIGLIHDLGKATKEFKEYLQYNVGITEKLGFKLAGSKLDHATAGAQILYEAFAKDVHTAFVADILSIACASHHGIIDALSPDGKDVLGLRLTKGEQETRKKQARANLESDIAKSLDRLLNMDLHKQVEGFLTSVQESEDRDIESYFKISMLVRYLLSCLIDADRTDAASFESGSREIKKKHKKILNWTELIDRFEVYLGSFKIEKEIDQLRKDVSQQCLEAAPMTQGFFRLTVPTGGGKTLASLRFALHHAQKHRLDRIIYVIPYTSIIDQNAERVREALRLDTTDVDVLLEHHSNIIPEKHGLDDEESEDYARYKLLAENWNSPIILTTMVQFLETLFSHSTNSCRRMHQLANSVIIFDEIQTLPIKMVHLFNLALKFFVSGCNSSVMLCTATQPLLHKLKNPARGLPYNPAQEIRVNQKQKVASLNRVEVLDNTRPSGWSSEELAELALNESDNKKSVLIIVNTKRKAADVYTHLHTSGYSSVFHLSTSMCPAHRIDKLNTIISRLEKKRPLILVSTQLIEAGVDVDFDVVIRSLAGIDSIAQAAGRCNRHGSKSHKGRVLIINSYEEKLSRLPEILCAQNNTRRLLAEFKADTDYFQNHLLSDPALDRYFQYYYHARSREMPYLVDYKSPVGRSDNLVDLLSRNDQSVRAYMNNHENQPPNRFLRQSFSTAGRAFEVIPNIGHGILVQYGKGTELINELAASYEPNKQFTILRQAQRYSVNCFRHELEKLAVANALFEAQRESGILYLDERFYHKELGLTDYKSKKSPTLIM